MINKYYFIMKCYLFQFAFFDIAWRIKKHFFKGDTLEEDLLYDAEDINLHWPESVKKPYIGLVQDYSGRLNVPLIAYWPRYQKYLDQNQIPYEFFDINSSDWLDNANKFDVILWHNEGDPASLHNAQTKFYLLENYLRKICLPNVNDLWSFEDKIRQYYLFRIHKIPTIETFITNDETEAMEYAEIAEYPLVSKLNSGSGSLGIELIYNKNAAFECINHVFSGGRRTYWTFCKQKDFIYFQKFISNAGYDLRVIAVGNNYFGYFRLTPPDDFRASGAGLIEKKKIPEKALFLAKSVKEKLNSNLIAVDMLKSENDSEYLVSEISISPQVDTPDELVVDGIPGYYKFEPEENAFIFHPGKYWLPELALNEIMNEWIAAGRQPSNFKHCQSY